MILSATVCQDGKGKTATPNKIHAPATSAPTMPPASDKTTTNTNAYVRLVGPVITVKTK